jgi:hypothetical protein
MHWLGVNRTVAHSPATFFRISISSAFRPAFVPVAAFDGLSRFPPRQHFSPQVLPLRPVPLHSSIDKTDSERLRDADTLGLRCVGTNTDLAAAGREHFAEDLPNPTRQGCPPDSTLELLADKQTEVEESVLTHLSSCSACSGRAATSPSSGTLGVEFRQDSPDDVVNTRRGKQISPLALQIVK